jgi:hypothetical protein
MPQLAPHQYPEYPETAPTGLPREDGVDLTLIRWMLSLTPAERLATLQQAVNSLTRLSHGRFTS